MSAVTITSAPLSLEDLLAVDDGARVELAPDVRETVRASRAIVGRALETGARLADRRGNG